MSNLRLLTELLRGAIGLLEAVSFMEPIESVYILSRYRMVKTFICYKQIKVF